MAVNNRPNIQPSPVPQISLSRVRDRESPGRESPSVAAAGKRLCGEATAAATAFHERGRGLLLEEGWAGICRLIGEESDTNGEPKRRSALDRLLNDFVALIGRLDYRGRLAAGQAIGSGPVEGAARTLGLRLKAGGGPMAKQECPCHGCDGLLRSYHPWGLFWSRSAYYPKEFLAPPMPQGLRQSLLD